METHERLRPEETREIKEEIFIQKQKMDNGEDVQTLSKRLQRLTRTELENDF